MTAVVVLAEGHGRDRVSMSGVGGHAEVGEVVQCGDEQVVMLGIDDVARIAAEQPDVGQGGLGQLDQGVEFAKVTSRGDGFSGQRVDR
jgi:hypothetical protein